MLGYIEAHEKYKREFKLVEESYLHQCQLAFEAKAELMSTISKFTEYAIPLETNRHYGSGCWLTKDILLSDAHVISDQLALDMLQINDVYLEPQTETGFFYRRPSTLGYYPDQFIGKMNAVGPHKALPLEFDEYPSANGSHFFYIDPHQPTLNRKIHFVTPEDALADLLKLNLETPHKKENGQSGSPLFEAKLMITGQNKSHWQIRLIGLIFGYDKESGQILAFKICNEIREVYKILSAKDRCLRLKDISLFSNPTKVEKAEIEYQLLVKRYEFGVCDSEILLPPNIEPLIEYKEVKMLRIDESVLRGKKSPIADHKKPAPPLPKYTSLEGFMADDFGKSRILNKEKYRSKKENQHPLKPDVLTLKTSLELLFKEIRSQKIYTIPLDTSQLNKPRRFFNKYFRLGESVSFEARNKFPCKITIDIQDQTKHISCNLKNTEKKSSFTMACVTFKFTNAKHSIKDEKNKIVGYYNAIKNNFFFDSKYLIKCLRKSKHCVGQASYNGDEKRENCVIEL